MQDNHDTLTEQYLQRTLEPGETVLWTGRPSQAWARRQSLGCGGIGCLLLLTPLVLILLRVEFASLGWFYLIPPVTGSLGIGLAILAYNMVMRTRYAITDRHALIVRGDASMRFSAGEFQPLELMPSTPGRGHVYFGVKRKGDAKSVKRIGFEDVESPRDVAALLVKHLGARLRENAAVPLPMASYEVVKIPVGSIVPGSPADELTFAPFLDDGETLLWSAKGDAAAMRSASAPALILVGLLFLVMGLGLLGFLAWLTYQAWLEVGSLGAAWGAMSKDATGGFVVGCVVGAVFLLFAWASFAALIENRRDPREGYFAITNRRVMAIVARRKDVQATVLPHISIGKVEVKRIGGGLSTLSFAEYKRNKSTHATHFTGISDGEAVAAMLADCFKKASA